ncbi:MAG: hypothetical protein ABIO82_06600 [Ginsengibacter sp.]
MNSETQPYPFNNCAITFQSVILLVRMTSIPIAINIFFIGTFPTSLAASGAATNPPKIKPAI